MVFGEIPLAGRSDKVYHDGMITMCSFSGGRSVQFALIEGRQVKVAAVRTSDDTPLTMNVLKFKHVGNKVTFNALAKHVELTFANTSPPPSVDRLAFYGEIPDSDAYGKQTFSAQEVKVATTTAQRSDQQKPAAAAKQRMTKAKRTVKGDTVVAWKQQKTKVKAKTKTETESDPKKVKVKFPKGTKRGTFSHIDTTKAPPPAIPPGALVINPPRVPVIPDEEEEDKDDETTIKNNHT